MSEHPPAHGEPGHVHDEACAAAHGDLHLPPDPRRLVLVFSSPVAAEMAELAGRLGWPVTVVDPEGTGGAVPSVAQAHLDAGCDVVVCDHERPELGDVLADALRAPSRWIGVMGSRRHTAPHVEALRQRGFGEEEIARVHRPIGLDIGSRTPPEIAVATVAGLLADRKRPPRRSLPAGVSAVRAVLLDFAGTLLVPEPREQWVAGACPELGPAEVAQLADALERAGRSGGPEPERLAEQFAADYARRDLSEDRHRALYEGLMAAVTGPGTPRTRALYDRGLSSQGWHPYPDALPVLEALRGRGIRTAVVSNVGFDLRRVFAGHGLDRWVDAFVLSYEVGVMKPEPQIFRAACDALGVPPAEALMVGDNPRADGGATDIGIRTLLLPYSPAGADHGLAAVLALL